MDKALWAVKVHMAAMVNMADTALWAAKDLWAVKDHMAAKVLWAAKVIWAAKAPWVVKALSVVKVLWADTALWAVKAHAAVKALLAVKVMEAVPLSLEMVVYKVTHISLVLMGRNTIFKVKRALSTIYSAIKTYRLMLNSNLGKVVLPPIL